MRLQLRSARTARVARRLGGRVLASVAACGAASSGVPRAAAQVVDVDTTHSVYYEAPTRTNMFVYTPGIDLAASPWEWLDVRGGWEADVVSGASVAVKAGSTYAANHPGADVITAASVHDLRNQAHGGFTLKNDGVAVTGGYAYSTEHDYRSNSFSVAAHTEGFEHDTQFDIAYARTMDRVCDRLQSTSATFARYVALEDSSGCFTSSNALRLSRPVVIDGFQASWSQAWTPVLATQLVYTAQVLDGFQSNPYRSVILAEGVKAQEHEPENRARHSLSLHANYFFRSLRAALRVGVRAYDDTWNVKSGTVDAELEKYLGESLRVTLRGRIYAQTGALFWSDDYTGGAPPLGPRGQYWTGDRELSPFWSWMLGARFAHDVALPTSAGLASARRPRILGLMTNLRLGLAFDLLSFHYDEYTLGGLPIANARAYLGSLDLTAGF